MTEVRSFMNPALVYILEDELAHARSVLARFGLSSLPILDDAGMPVGFVSLRDLDHDGTVTHVSCPVMTVTASEDVETAARILADSNVHHLVVVNDSGRAVGMISAVDLLRALRHLPARSAPFDVDCTYSEEP